MSFSDRVGGGGAAGGVAAVVGTQTPADNLPTPADCLDVRFFGQLYDGATWDMWRSSLVLGAADVTERLMPAAEDNPNAVYAVVPRPLAVSTYCASQNTNQGASNAANIKASAGNVFSIRVGNTNAAARYLFFVNTAGAPVAGSASLILPLLVPGGSQVLLGEDFFGQTGINFATGIGLAMMTTLAGGTLATAGETYWTVRYL